MEARSGWPEARLHMGKSRERGRKGALPLAASVVAPKAKKRNKEGRRLTEGGGGDGARLHGVDSDRKRIEIMKWGKNRV